MAASGDLIDFNVIEGHKENIQALPSGRSAKALAQLYSPPLLGQTPSPALTNEAHSKEREAFEKELQTVGEADDPLDIYDRYVKWTLETYPSAQATPQSQLVQLLERATKAFQNSPHYKNDARYLKFWLQYVGHFSDSPREIYSFLARHGIGEKLALYYEEFAAYLEKVGRWNQAEEIYKMGIENEAHPTSRLIRKFGEFEQRKDARSQRFDEPSSPALPPVRAVLAAKLDPFQTTSPHGNQQQQSAKSTASKKTNRSKMQVFSDTDAVEPRPGSGGPVGERESIATLAERKKENRHEAKPWVGEKLMTGKTNGGMEKIAVFKDQSSHMPLSFPTHLLTGGGSHNHQRGRNPKTGRQECVFVNLEAIYPAEGIENSFEELIARRRMSFRRDWSRPRQSRNRFEVETLATERQNLDRDSQQASGERPLPADEDMQQPSRERKREFQIFQDQSTGVQSSETTPEVNQDMEDPEPRQKIKQRAFNIYEDDASNKIKLETRVQTLALNDQNDENKAPSQEEMALAKQLRKEARQNRTRKIKVMDVKHINSETKTIQLNMDSPPKTKVKRKKSIASAEPTMTITTKEALDEIYGIFNQPIESQADSEADDDEASDDEYTTDAESTATGKLSGPGSEYGEETRNEIFQSQEDGEHDDASEHTEVTGWSDFTMNKPAPSDLPEDSTLHDAGTGGSWDLNPSRDVGKDNYSEDAVTPVDEHPRPNFAPLPPEGYEPPTGQYRDAAVVANNRLPFMTPIVEQTETSMGATTVARRSEKDYYNPTKTPSRKKGSSAQPLDDSDNDELCSSPFQEESIDLEEDKRRVLMPIRTKSTKGTISLGQGTAKSQIAAKSTSNDVASGTETQQKGPLITDLQCNPMDPQLRLTIISQMKPPLSSYEGYHEYLDAASERGSEIKKYAAKQLKAKGGLGGDKTPSAPTPPPKLALEGADGDYTFRRELGAGTFAPVYLVENSAASYSEGDEKAVSSRAVGKTPHRRPLEAVKMEDPPSAWEFYILRQSQRRLNVSRAAESIVRAHEMHLYRDECFLVEEYRDQGTLLDLVNIAKQDSGNSSGGLDEVLAMWLSVELLRTVEALHSKQLIHGDLKADNILVRFDDPGSETDWNATYFPSGAHGWSSKGVCLIDFGRGIDMKQFLPGVGFIADWKTTDADCAEMRELRPWTFQIDYHGLAGIIFTLLFGRYMETVAEKGAALGQGATKTYKIRESLKRYWQTEIWSEVFALLLNPLAHLAGEADGKMPICKSMRVVREKMEAWLEENCERGLGLKGMIVRMEMMIRDRRRKIGKPAAC